MTLPLERALTATGMNEGDVYRLLSNLVDLINELQEDHATLRAAITANKTLANAVQASFKDGLLAIGTLAIDATAEKFKTTSTAVVRIGSIQYSKAAETAIVFSASHVVSASKFGVILVQMTAAGVVSTKVPSGTQAYNSAPLALAALPAADSAKIALGYIAIAAKAATWTANTDDLTNASDLTTATFIDATPLTAFTDAAVSDSAPDALTNSTALKLTSG
jgi:type IV pilus biogenesis protein CpaD/CtpE